MTSVQPGILAPVQRVARYLEFVLDEAAGAAGALAHLAAAGVAGQGAGLDGGSFVAVQQWQHDLDRFAAMSRAEQDATFGRSFDAFEAQMRHMVGAEDGVTDALFRFTRPITSAGYWCPPVRSDGRLDLRALGP